MEIEDTSLGLKTLTLSLGDAPGACLCLRGAVGARLQNFTEGFRRRAPRLKIYWVLEPLINSPEADVVQAPFER